MAKFYGKIWNFVYALATNNVGTPQYGSGGNGSENTASKATPGMKMLPSINLGGDNYLWFRHSDSGEFSAA